MKSKLLIILGIFSVVLSGLALPVRPAQGQQDEKGIPSTAFARLKIDKGTAWVRTSDSGDWQEAVSNYPLVEKSRVSVPKGSEAEIQFHGSQSLVLQSGSEVDIQKLSEKEVSYRLRSGKAELSLRAENFAPVRMTVPGNRDVRADAPGRYSLSTDGATTRFGVTAGAGAVTGKGGSDVVVKAGEEASIGDTVRVSRTGKASSETVPEEAVVAGPEKEAGIPPSVDEELQPYGEWVSTPEYGYAWRPYVDDGWEPFYYGEWVWISPYGWTWVAYEPWGWWPYHTGWWWPSPVFGWVWCPFNSFVSFNFFFGNSVFFNFHARFFPGNVRFFGRDQFVRWVPERPGVIASRTLSRSDTRLAGWNRPVDRGSVMVRHNGGAPVAWEGRGGRTSVTASNRGTRMQGERSGAAVRAPVTRNRTLGTPPSRSGNYGVRAPASSRGEGVRSFSRGGGRMSGNPGVRTGPPRNATSAGSRGFNQGFRSPGGSGRGGGGGGFRGFR
ncbi:DUF6600 domain-containing protein [Candidatus Deferrimicrobium sp.]|uniref:DUF6600 domain-containing protein n=1 Tax=Candidatus Deferrimicrobium sp. TaxID=3060586 RepID=UPI002ED51449